MPPRPENHFSLMEQNLESTLALIIVMLGFGALGYELPALTVGLFTIAALIGTDALIFQGKYAKRIIDFFT